MSQLPQANKTLGQHFLVDKKVISKITEDFKEEAKAIVEVGPGPGILTENLSAHQLPLHVIDKDERFPEYLKKFVDEDKIHITDALEWDLEAGFKEWEYPENDIWMVSNLPYNVSTPLLIQSRQCSLFCLSCLRPLRCPAACGLSLMGADTGYVARSSLVH